MQKKLFLISVLLLQLIATSTQAAKQDFFKHSNQYRGFYWFEQEQKKSNQQDEKPAPTFESMSPSKAVQNIEERKVKLAEARSVMMELSFQGASREEIYKAVRHYKMLENQMRDSGMALASAWEMVNFTNPEFVDRINNPVNAAANRVKRKYEAEQNALKIKEFASKYDLVLFEKESCPYCQAFKPIIGRFVAMHGFKLDVVGDNPEHLQLINILNIKAAPTLVAVRKDGKDAFELARSLLTLSELEQQVMSASELLENNLQINSTSSKSKRKNKNKREKS